MRIHMLKDSDFGLVIDWTFHKKRKWSCALTSYLVNGIVKKFNPVIISSQREYNRLKKKLNYIVSLEPGWAAPKLNYDTHCECIKAVFYSDPHFNTQKRWDYFTSNGFDYVFSYYYNPFFYHFNGFPEEKFIHMPWAIPDHLILDDQITVKSNDVIIFGAKKSDAYDIRNWCREQDEIINYDNSGVENKKMDDEGYFRWLSGFDAIIAAGSSDPKYDLVTPKYFEIASSGALLVGQYCNDLDLLGFNNTNSLIFTKEDFIEKIISFKSEPEKYLATRKEGRNLIRAHHKVSDRIKQIEEVFYGK